MAMERLGVTVDARRRITPQKAGCQGRRLPPVPPRPRGVGAVIDDDAVGVAWRVHDRGDSVQMLMKKGPEGEERQGKLLASASASPA